MYQTVNVCMYGHAGYVSQVCVCVFLFVCIHVCVCVCVLDNWVYWYAGYVYVTFCAFMCVCWRKRKGILFLEGAKKPGAKQTSSLGCVGGTNIFIQSFDKDKSQPHTYRNCTKVSHQPYSHLQSCADSHL